MKWSEAKSKILDSPEARRAYERVDLEFEIGEMITELRVLLGLSQADVARRMDTKQPSVARAESGNCLPSLSFLKRMAAACGTELLPPKFKILRDAEHLSIYKNLSFRNDNAGELLDIAAAVESGSEKSTVSTEFYQLKEEQYV